MTTYTKTYHSKAILAVLALLLVPGLAFAQSKKSSSSTVRSSPSTVPMARSNEVGTFAVGGTLGLSLGLGDTSGGTGFRLTGNGYYTVTEFTPQLPFDIGGHVGFTYAGCGGEDFEGAPDCSLMIIEVTPAARLRYKVIPKLSLYADIGLGFDIAMASVGDESDSEFALMMRLASGVQYQIADQLYLTGEPLGLSFYFHDNSVTRYNLSAGLLYRF